MRRLWIKRHKASAGRMTAMNVYIEDPEQGEVTINGIPCRKLGEVKNGRKMRFSVEEDARKIFVVRKAGGKGEQPFVQLEDGRDDIFLSGRVSGRGFRFDGMEETSAGEKQRRGRGLGTVILVIAILLGIAGGIFAGWKISNALLNNGSDAAAEEKTFAAAGMEITLTEDFAEGTVPGYTACYASGEVSVYVLREGFDAFEGFADLSLAGYATMVLGNNGLTDTVQLKEEESRVSFDHRYTAADGREYAYHCIVMKGSDAFWLVQFAVPGEAEAEYASDIGRWAQSITLAD